MAAELPTRTPAEPVLDLPDVAGSLDEELAEQRIGEDHAVITGLPGISTIHCLTARTAPFELPTL